MRLISIAAAAAAFALPVLAQVAATPAAVPPPAPPSVEQADKLLTTGQLGASLAMLDTLAATRPEPAGVEKLRGMVFYQQGNMPDAVVAFTKAVDQDAHDIEAMQMQGVSLFREGRPADAIPLLEQAHTAVKGANIDPNYVLGLCYMDTRRYDDARKAFAPQYGFAPDSAAAYLLAARLFLRREYLPVAEESARKAIALDPRLPLANLLLGEVALAKSRFDEAIADFTKERELNPLSGELYDRLGDAYIRSGNYDQAFLALNKAVLLEPSSTGPFILLGKVLLKQKDPLMARQYLERAVSMDPDNYMAHGLLGQAYRALGRPEDAARELQKTTEIQARQAPRLETPK